MNLQELLNSKGIQFKVSSKGWINLETCPFCMSETDKYTFGIHEVSGGFHCLRGTCGVSGTWKQLLQKINGLKEVKFENWGQKQEEEVPDGPPLELNIEGLHQEFLKHLESKSDLWKYIEEKRGYTFETIKQFKLGWWNRSVIIPIFDRDGLLRNVRIKPDPTRTPKSSLYGIEGYNKNRIFNEAVLFENPEYVIICEGEWDCIKLTQEGFTAVTATAGTGSWKEEWCELLKGISRVFVLQDWDEPGKKGAARTLKTLKKSGIEPYNIQLSNLEVDMDVTDYFNRGNSPQDFQNLLDTTSNYRRTNTPESIQSFEELAKEVEAYMPNSRAVLKLVLAVATSGTRKNRVMLWLMLVDVPSSGKTEFLKFIKACLDVLSMDTLTLNAFISGERPKEGEQVHDLLPRLNGKCLAVKDWTVIFSLDERACKKIIGDMVGAYDKSLSKHSSSRGLVSYTSEFSHIGCITPATLNKHTNYLNMIGPRFLMYTMPELSSSQEAESFNVIFKGKRRETQEKQVSESVCRFLNTLNQKDFNQDVEFSTEVIKYLTTCSRFVARARGVLIMSPLTFTNEEKKVIHTYELLSKQVERPFRAAQQLMVLARYLAYVEGRDEINSDDLEILRDVVLSSMPADRAQAIRAFKNIQGRELTAKELSASIEKSDKTARRLLDELVILEILEKEKGEGTIATTYKIKDEFKNLLTVHPREFMSAYNVAPASVSVSLKEHIQQDSDPTIDFLTSNGSSAESNSENL